MNHKKNRVNPGREILQPLRVHLCILKTYH